MCTVTDAGFLARSGTPSSAGWIGYVVVGASIGWWLTLFTAILGAVILLGSSRCAWGHCPSPERSTRTAGPAAPTTGGTRRETVTSPSTLICKTAPQPAHLVTQEPGIPAGAGDNR